MKIVVAVRCLNGVDFIERFLKGYSFADSVVVSDGGSTDGSLDLWKQDDRVTLLHFKEREVLEDGRWWNPDAPHMNYVIREAEELNPDWLIFDDLDCWPGFYLNKYARDILQNTEKSQVNVFRLYMWGDAEFFPKMNDNFNLDYTSLWAWQPDKVHIYADEDIRHGTLKGFVEDPFRVDVPYCLLHYSWHPNTIEEKLEQYRAIGFEVDHPFDMPNAGKPKELPEWVNG